MAAANSSEPKDQHHENRTESLKAERVYWDRVWERLAEADGHDRKSAQYGKSGYPSINIEQLKNRVKVEDAKEVIEIEELMSVKVSSMNIFVFTD